MANSYLIKRRLNSRKFRLACNILLTLASTAIQAAPPDQQLPPPVRKLFLNEPAVPSIQRLPAQAADHVASPFPPGAVRSRQVEIDWDMLRALSPSEVHRVSINLFNDRALVAVLEKLEHFPGGHVWMGRIEDIPHSEIYIAEVDGVMHGKIRTPGQKPVTIETTGEDDTYITYETDFPAQLIDNGGAPPSENDDRPPIIIHPEPSEPIPYGDLEEDSLLIQLNTFDESLPSTDHHEAHVLPSLALSAENDAQANNSETWIDIAVFYTDDARRGAGGAAAIQAIILAAIAQANATHAAGDTNARLRLVYRGEISYAETGNIETDLNRLKLNGDNHLDAVFAIREQYGADLIHLFTESTANSGSTIGFAQTPGSFGITKRSRALDLTFSHEIGHNLGLCHQTASSNPNSICTASYTGKAHEAVAKWFEPIFNTVICEEKRQTVMWSTSTSTIINSFSNPSDTVAISPPFLCFDGGTLNRAIGTSHRNNVGMTRTRRGLSADDRQASFYVKTGAGEGIATQYSPENDVADIYNQWSGLPETNNNENFDVHISPGNYKQPLLLNKKSTLKRWGSSGTVTLGK